MCSCLSAGHPAGEDPRGAGELHAETRGEHHRHPGGRGGPPGERTQGAELLNEPGLFCSVQALFFYHSRIVLIFIYWYLSAQQRQICV